MSVKVEAITEPLGLGEGPHWDDRVQALYFVDIPRKSIHKYNAVTKAHTKTVLDTSANFIVPVEGHLDQFVVGMGREVLVLQWDGVEDSPVRIIRHLGEVDADIPYNHINDGKADPRGRLYTGSMPQIEGSLDDMPKLRGSMFRVDGRGITNLDYKVTLANGLAWDLDRRAMYYIDTMEKNIRRYDYDVDTGDISNMSYLFDFEKNNQKGFPDGMTIDTDGNLWVATFLGSCVLQISPDGKLLRRVTLPVEQVTSCTFGGPNLDVLFVTTGNFKMLEAEPKPQSGCTFMITGLGVKGHPNVNFKF